MPPKSAKRAKSRKSTSADPPRKKRKRTSGAPVTFAAVPVTSRPSGLPPTADIVTPLAWGPSIPSEAQPWMNTPTGAAANILSRVWWPFPADRLNAVDVLHRFVDLVEDVDSTNILRRALELLDTPVIKSKVTFEENSTALALLSLSGSGGARESTVAQDEIISHLVTATASMAMSATEGVALRRIMENAISLIGACLRQWTTSNSHHHVMKTESLHAHAAKKFYIAQFSEFTDTEAVKLLVEDAARLDQVNFINKGMKCSFSGCNRVARLPSVFCASHFESVKRANGSRNDIKDEDDALKRQRKSTLEFLHAPTTKKLLKASSRRVASIRRGKAVSQVTVSRQGRVAVYDRAAAAKIAKQQEESAEYQVRSVELLLPPKLGASMPSKIKRLLEEWRKADAKVFTPDVRAAMPWFRIHWQIGEDDKTAPSPKSDDSDFEPVKACLRKSEDKVGTSWLMDCPEPMAQGIVDRLLGRPRSATFMANINSATNRVSRHTGKWPKDFRHAVKEFSSVLAILDPEATCAELLKDNPQESFDVGEHTAIISQANKACEQMFTCIGTQASEQTSSNQDKTAKAARNLTDAVSMVAKVSRWTAKKQFNTHLVHDALASLLGALCIVTRRWIHMPTYTAIQTTTTDDECILWSTANLCRATTVKMLGVAANEASIALDRFPGYAEYVPQEIQNTVAQQVYSWLESSGLDPTIIVQLSNEPISHDKLPGATPSGPAVVSPTQHGAVDGIVNDKDGVPLVEVARWGECLDEMGYGVRAKSFIPAGTRIASVSFRVFHPSRRESKYALEDPDGITRCIDDRSIVRWMNGADFKRGRGYLRPKANIIFTSLSTENPFIWLETSEDIECGEEVTMRYGTTFRSPNATPSKGTNSGISDSVIQSLEADKTMQAFGRITQLPPAWSEDGIQSFDATGSTWAARRWASVETKLIQADKSRQEGFYSTNAPTEFYHTELSKLAIAIPQELTYVPRDASGRFLLKATEQKPKTADFFNTDLRGNIKGFNDDFDASPYGASILSYHGVREVVKIGVSPREVVKGKSSGRATGDHFNRALRDQQPRKQHLKATITDAHIRPLSSEADETTKKIHAHSLLLQSDICRSIQDIHPVGPCVLRSYLDPTKQDPDAVVPTQLTLQGMNSCTLFATFNHTYEGVWHIEPDSSISLNENIGMHDGFVIIVSDKKAIMDICKLHLFMEMAAPGGVDLSELRKGSTKHGAIEASHRGLPWLSRPPHPELLAKLGIDTSSFKVYRQKPGDIIFIPGGALHAVVHCSPSVRVACGYVSTADACRTVLRSARFHNEGSKSTFWSVTKSVNQGDVDFGVALNVMAEDHRKNKNTARWARVDIVSLCALVAECIETLSNTRGFKKIGSVRKRRGTKKGVAAAANLTAVQRKQPVKCQVAGTTGPTFMVTPTELIAAGDYFRAVASNTRPTDNGQVITFRHRGELVSPTRSPARVVTTVQQGPRPHRRLSLKKKTAAEPTPDVTDEDIMTVSEELQSSKALSRRGKKSQFTALHNWQLLRNVVRAEFAGLTDVQRSTLENSLRPDRFGNERALQVELALLETACNEVLGGKSEVIFQHPSHQLFCRKAMDGKIGTAEDVQQALQTPPVRDIPGQGPVVHVFTLNIGDNFPTQESRKKAHGRPDHFASVVCRTDSTVACVLDSAASCAPISRGQAIENLRTCLCAAQFFNVKGQIQMLQARVSTQDIANRDYTCMERAVLNAAYVACFENKPYDNVAFAMDMAKYTRLAEITGDLLNEVKRNERSEEAPSDLRNDLIDDAIKSSVDATVALLRSIAPTEARRTSPRKTSKTVQ